MRYCGSASAERSPEERRENQQRTSLVEMHREAAAFFAQQLNGTPKAGPKAYLLDRDLIPKPWRGSVLASAVGWRSIAASDESRNIRRKCWRFRPVQPRSERRLYDRFAGASCFPSPTNREDCGVRRAGSGDDLPKYLNSPETPIYSKSNILYHLDRAKESLRQRDFAVLVEGYMDRLRWRSRSLECGRELWHKPYRTASEALDRFTRASSSTTIRHGGAGRTERSLSILLEQGVEVRVLRCPAARTRIVSSVRRRRGVCEITERSATVRGLPNLSRQQDGPGLREGKLRAVNFLMPYVQRIPDRILRSNGPHASRNSFASRSRCCVNRCARRQTNAAVSEGTAGAGGRAGKPAERRWCKC